MNGAGLFGIYLFIVGGFLLFVILAALIRYSVDSSKMSKKLGQLTEEVRQLRSELHQRNSHIDRQV